MVQKAKTLYLLKFIYEAFRFEIFYEPTKLIDNVMLGLVTVHRTIWETP